MLLVKKEAFEESTLREGKVAPPLYAESLLGGSGGDAETGKRCNTAPSKGQKKTQFQYDYGTSYGVQIAQG